MQQHIYRQLNELMGGLLPSYVVPAHGFHVLDIGWGMGESVHELALKYPSAHITGIDMDVSTVEHAQSLVRRLANATIFVQDFHHLDDTVLTPAAFGLIHLHFLALEISLQQLPSLLSSLACVSRPGGLLVWTEAELPITTSLACQHVCGLILQALQTSGHALSQGNSSGLTAQMSGMLDDAGYRCTHSKAYAIDISARSRGNDAFITQLSLSRSQIRAFLLESELVTITEFEDLYVEMQQEIQEEQFCGLLYVRTVVASRL
ncbi:MAG: class I SAM-dependent methyltransferase [Ktedonobacteraceae bacterium]